MALRYTAGFNGLNGYKKTYPSFELEIDDPSFDGEPIDILMGANPLECDYSPSDTTNKLSPFIRSFISFELIVNNDFQYSHIYTDKEREFKVTVKKDGDVWGSYFIEPSGAKEMFTDPPYTVTVKANDGLGLLHNLEYTHLVGRESVLKIILKALGKLDLNMNINTFSTISYEGMAGTDPYAETFVWQERFENEDESGMDCEAVIGSLLKEWLSCIVQMNGEWYLFRYNDLQHENGVVNFMKYDPDGNYIGLQPIDINGKLIASGQGEASDYIHVHADQVVYKEFAYKEVAIRHEYGYFRNLLMKGASELKGDVVNFYEWDKIGGIAAIPSSLFNNKPAIINGRNDGYGKYIALKEPIPVEGARKMKIEIVFNVQAANGLGFDIVLSEGMYQSYLDKVGEWAASPQGLLFSNYIDEGGSTRGIGQTIRASQEFYVPANYTSPHINIRIYPSIFFGNNIFTGHPGIASVYSVKLHVVSNEDQIISETYRVISESNCTHKPEPIEVMVGESQEDVYLGTLFKPNGDAAQGFKRDSDAEYSPFLLIAAQDVLYQHGRAMNVYEGSILGTFPFIKKIHINGLNGYYFPSSLTYSFKHDTVKARLVEIGTDPIPHTGLRSFEYEDMPSVKF